MLEQIKVYSNLIVSIVILIGLAFLGYKIYHAGYDKARSEDAAAAQAQSDNSRITDAKNQALIEKGKQDYEQIKTTRDDALAKLGHVGLCSSSGVLRSPSVPVARQSSDSMPSVAEAPARVDNTAEMAASFDFANALKDHDQCEALIKSVCALGMCE